MGLRVYTLSRREFCSHHIPPASQLMLHLHTEATPLGTSTLLTSLYVVSYVNLVFDISVQVAFSWLFRLIAL